MKMKKIILACTLLFVTFLHYTVQAQNTVMSKKQADKWFKKQQYLNGLRLKPHKSVNAQEFARQYQANRHLWDTAFGFLRTHDLVKLPTGKYLLAGDSAFVSVTEGPLKEFEKTQWEAHKKYIDVQYVARGKEKIGVAPVSKATVTEPYNAEKDVAHFKSEGKYYVAEPGTFFIFFPQDAHRPTIKVDVPEEKKVVVKVMAAP
jgi:YhcH/YjgK/YiaL family protein